MGISEHDLRPRDAIERERRAKEIAEKRDRDQYTAMLTGKAPDQKTWQKYVKRPDKFNQMGTSKPQPLFKRESYMEPMIMVARQMRDDIASGKPIFHLYNKRLGAHDVNVELNGAKIPFKPLE